MAVPEVTCNANATKKWKNSNQSVSLGATATNGPTAWEWTMLSIPDGSTVNVGVNGSFLNGVAVIQNPIFSVPAGEVGTYVFQCVATNGDGDSVPFDDKGDGQQEVQVHIPEFDGPVPNDHSWVWGVGTLVSSILKLARQIGGRARDVQDRPITHIYVDGTSGNDDNDGSDWANAIKTIDYAWMDFIPTVVSSKYVIHFKGNVTDSGPLGGWFDGKILAAEGGVMFTGEDGYDVTAAGPYTATVSSTASYIEVSPSPGWAGEAERGKWIRFTSGPQSGQVRGVIWNSADELSLNADLSGQTYPATFEFVEPKSLYNGYFAVSIVASEQYAPGIVYHHFRANDWLEFYGAGRIWYQNIMMDGGDIYVEGRSNGDYYATQVHFSHLARDPSTFNSLTDRIDQGGISFLPSGGGTHEISAESSRIDVLVGALCKSIYLNNCFINYIGSGLFYWSRTRIAGSAKYYAIEFRNCKMNQWVGSRLHGVEAHSGSSDIMRVYNSEIRFGSNVALYNSSGNGIHAVNSDILMYEVVAGASITGYGVKLRHKSRLGLKIGITPTITGTAGDITVDTGNSTWATIVGGTPLIDSIESSYARVDDILSDANW